METANIEPFLKQYNQEQFYQKVTINSVGGGEKYEISNDSIGTIEIVMNEMNIIHTGTLVVHDINNLVLNSTCADGYTTVDIEITRSSTKPNYTPDRNIKCSGSYIVDNISIIGKIL